MNKYLIQKNATLLDALRALNNLSDAGLTLFVIDENRKVVGTVTDGDIRRAIVLGGSLSDRITVAMQENFSFFLSSEKENVNKFKELKSRNINIVPVLDEVGNFVSVLDLRKMRSMLPVDAVLMAGGKGERLRPLTEKTPKPLLPVGDKAIIDYNVERLISYGIEHVAVTVNYLREQIEDHFAKPKGGIKVVCVREPKYLGTIGSVKFVEAFYNDTILVMNSDLFTNIDYEDFYLHFKENEADMSVAAVPYSISVPYGIFELDGRNIEGIKEKPTYNYYANAGIYLIKRELIDKIPEDTFFDATDFMAMLIKEKKKVVRFPITGYWIDIGKPEDYRKAQEFVKHLIS